MKTWLIALVLFGSLAVPLRAQDSGDSGRGVARISVVDGDVAVRRGDTGETIDAELNAPLVARDHLLTESNSRAEIQFDRANVLRLDSNSEVRLAEIEDGDYLIQIAQGTVTFRVLENSDARVELSTPSLSFRPRREGIYRLRVRDDFSTEVTVRSGEAEFFVGKDRDYLQAGQTLWVSPDPSDPQRRYLAAIPRDTWDRWNEDRDRDLERIDSTKYASRDIYGLEDLDHNGRWVYDPPYGWVWAPNVAADWAPYRVGRWSWVDYYGWTWISGDPWGWAPYHYGRWYHGSRFGWVWYPGEARTRHYWSPALVAFFDWDVNFGWVALGPHEIYRPWYGPGRSLVVVNRVTVIDTYQNARFFGGRSGITSVRYEDFGRRRIHGNDFVYGTDRDLRRAAEDRRGAPQPSREARRFSEREERPRSASNRNDTLRFVTGPDRGNRQQRLPAETRQAGNPAGDSNGNADSRQRDVRQGDERRVVGGRTTTTGPGSRSPADSSRSVDSGRNAGSSRPTDSGRNEERPALMRRAGTAPQRPEEPPAPQQRERAYSQPQREPAVNRSLPDTRDERNDAVEPPRRVTREQAIPSTPIESARQTGPGRGSRSEAAAPRAQSPATNQPEVSRSEPSRQQAGERGRTRSRR